MLPASNEIPPAPPPEGSGRFDLFDLARLTTGAPPPPVDEDAIPPVPLRPETERPVAVPMHRVPRWAQAATALAIGVLTSVGWSAYDAPFADTIVTAPAQLEVSAASAPTAQAPEPAPSVVQSPSSIDAEPSGERARRRRSDLDDMSEAQYVARYGQEPALAVEPEPASPDEVTVARADGPRAEPTAEPEQQPSGSLEALLDRAVGAAAPAVAEQASELGDPRGPSREQVLAAMEGIRPALEQCADGRHGLARLHLVVSPQGRVRGVRVRGSFAGSAQGSCMARAARQARFAQFDGEATTVRYPYRF